MREDLEELIKDAEKVIRKASGVLLTEDEQSDEAHKAAVDELQKFLLRRLGTAAAFGLMLGVTWSADGPVGRLDTGDNVFHVRKAAESDSYRLFIVEGSAEREVFRIEASDPQFGSRILVAIGDSIGRG